jgi:cation diffusion facilitator family transporter
MVNNLDSKEEKLKKARKVALVAGLTTIFFAVAKALVGFISGSIVLMADAVHSAADSFATFFAWLGLRIAQKKPTEKFPYGFYKVENITALIISGLILFAGFEIIKESINKIFALGGLNNPLIAVGVAFLDAIVMFFIGSYEVKAGKKVDSQSLIADGRESRMHLFSSTIVLIGLFARWFGIMYLEGIMGILISLFIFAVGIESAKDAIFVLMDVSPRKEIEKKVTRAIQSVSGIEEFFDLRLRKAGPFIFGETKVGIRKSVEVQRAHEFAEKVEKIVKEKVPQIDSFTIHVEPFRSNWRHLAIPVRENDGLKSRISNRFGRSPYFLFLNLKAGQIKGFYFLKNPYKEKSVRAGLSAAKLIMEQKSDVLITPEIGEISFYTLRDYLVDLYQAKGKTAKEVIDYFIAGKLSQLGRPTKEKA